MRACVFVWVLVPCLSKKASRFHSFGGMGLGKRGGRGAGGRIPCIFVFVVFLSLSINGGGSSGKALRGKASKRLLVHFFILKKKENTTKKK
ncbi:hypothetical protein IE53DRAFT_137351 [Violaceomyces palustris]|uniref:Uncharacterized protein n=1 Tax=Violaceomyces palustris TaxID=1673888 RepID=A0ACD0P6D0_9BASI|nr:hypothetical protein IE53DRAFT_137351 [Violaceomyces palustris]